MAKKLNNKTLLIILAALLGVYGLSTLLAPDYADSNFESVSIDIDTASVTSILFYPKSENLQEIKLTKQGTDWMVQKGSTTAKADPRGASAVLGSLVGVKPQRLVSDSKDKWKDYEVTDSLGTRVKVYAGSKLLTDVMLGKFAFQQQPQSMTSHIRMYEDDRVFSVDGPLSMAFSRTFDSFRDKSFVAVNKANVNKVSLVSNGTPLTAAKGPDGKWSGIDSTAIDGYLNGLAMLNGASFKEGYTASGEPMATMTIEGNNMPPATIKCYKDVTGFVLNSSQNPDNFFASDSTGTYQTLISNFSKLFGR